MSESAPGGRVQPARPGDPSHIGPYRIIGRLGAGGMGTVHAGVTGDGMRVAVKVVHPEQAQEPEFRARFRREVELSSRVTGPYLVPLLAADPEAQTPWLATAFVPGPTLNQHITAHGPLAEGSLYAFAAATAQALAAIHAAGVTHRDVKPQNVLLTPAGPRVLDFGIAHAADGTSVTRTGVMTGTPGWISPEQYREGTAGPAGDLFAWGALVAYAATGQLPFGTGAPDVVAFRVMSGEFDLSGVPAALRGVVERALSQKPDDRPSAGEAAEECSGLLAAQVTQVVGPDAAIPGTAVDMIAAVWDMPTAEDPTWRLQLPAGPGGRRSKKRIVGAVVLAAGVIGGLAGAVVALLPGDTGGGGTHAVSSSSASPSGSVQPTVSAAQDASPAAKHSSGAEASATVDDWRQARAAQGAGEHDVARALLHDEGVIALEDLSSYADFTPETVRFHPSRREVYLSYRLTADEQTAMYAETTIAQDMCLSVRDVVLRLHPDLPYRKYVMVKETSGGDPEVTWQDDFVTNSQCKTGADNNTGGTDQDYSLGADDWQPDDSGLSQAMIPSTDNAEIRVAAGAARKIITRSNAMRYTLGTDRVLGNEQIMVGFDPAHSAMYVWSDYVAWDQDEIETWAGMAAGEACRALVNERESAGSSWPYTRWAVAEGGASAYEMVRWGTASSAADCPS
ncbi:serine/threonine protein kinase [Streptomyces sp. YIM S03343]